MRWPNHCRKTSFDTSAILCTFLPTSKSMRLLPRELQRDMLLISVLAMLTCLCLTAIDPWRFAHFPIPRHLSSPVLIDTSSPSLLASLLHSQAPHGSLFEQSRMHTHQRYGFRRVVYFFFYATLSQTTFLFFSWDLGVPLRSGSVTALSNPTVCFDMWQPLLNPSSSASNLLISSLHSVLSLDLILSPLSVHVLFSFILVINSKTLSPWKNPILTMFTWFSLVQSYSYFSSFGILVKKPIVQSHLLLHLFIWDERNMSSSTNWWKTLITDIYCQLPLNTAYQCTSYIPCT